MKVKFIIPCFNSNKNMETLVCSLLEQTNDNWSAIFIDDVSDSLIENDIPKNEKFLIIRNLEKKFALKNIVDAVNEYCNDDDIVAVIDGDDSLCNKETVQILLNAYDKGHEVVWTAHKWDINGMNISKELPDKINPYQYQWCSSHLRTFKANLLKKISNKNFQNHKGEWFKRGYDQALMLPLIFSAKSWEYIPVVCYQYNINSVSMPKRDWTEDLQLQTINFVRARGFKQ